MIPGGWEEFAGRRILLLQGPVGPFFRRLAGVLRQAGAVAVHKVNFNGGDLFFHVRDSINYRGAMETWPQRLAEIIADLRIDTVFLYGDCREIHVPVRAAAKTHGVDVWVFEEGYVRPDFVTLERSGVNSLSPLPRDPAFYRQLPDMELPAEKPVGNTFWYAACWAFLYYLAAILLRPWYPRYRHHRPLSVREIVPWLRSPVRKAIYRMRERNIMPLLCEAASKEFFLLPLQVSSDFQVRVHSNFESVASFIEHTVASFAAHAHPDHYLAIKHHPMDRGYHSYTRLIRELADRYALQDRLLYLHDQHLPTLLDHARGVVVINSTVGLSALVHQAPLAVLGEAVYALPGLCFQGNLDDFWSAAETFRPDPLLYKRFRAYLIRCTQLNGSFFRHGIFDWKHLGPPRTDVPMPACCGPRVDDRAEDPARHPLPTPSGKIQHG